MTYNRVVNAAVDHSPSPNQEPAAQSFYTERDCLRAALVSLVVLIGTLSITIALQTGACAWPIFVALMSLIGEAWNLTRIRRGIRLPKPAKKAPRVVRNSEILLGFIVMILLSAGTIWMTTQLLSVLHLASPLRSICAIIAIAFLSAQPALWWKLFFSELPLVKLKAAAPRVNASGASEEVPASVAVAEKSAHWWTDTPLREELQRSIRR